MFFEELNVPRPARELGAGTGSNTAQTARILAALEPVLAELRPALALVYGDTNSTLAGALAAAQAGIPVGHVEAGMRSFDRTMPEELNRVLTDHASDLLLCSTPTSMANLEREACGRRGASGRRRDGGRVARVPRRRGAAFAHSRGARSRVRRLSRRDRASGRQRRRSGPPRGARDRARAAAAARRVPRAPAHSRAARRGRPDGPPGRRARWSRRSATSTSSSLLGTRAPCSPTPVECRRRHICSASVHHAPGPHRVGRDGRDGLEHARRPRCRRGACRAGRAASGGAPRAVRRRPGRERVAEVLAAYTARL